MNEEQTQQSIEAIFRMKNSGQFLNYIEFIEFPYYKNMVPGTRISFDFPLTVLVGKNGGGKSSTLHAMYGAPFGHSCSDFWFSTKVDPIDENGGRPRYYYGYKTDKNSETKEVMMSRIRREKDPDYWETTRPNKKDGMKSDIRNTPVEKEVVYLDFRAEVSAFDKVLHFSREGLDDRKKLLRNRSMYLKRLFNNEPHRFKGPTAEHVASLVQLDDSTVKIISEILGKSYVGISVADHCFFKNFGTSVYLKTDSNGNYSEANAGSGEIAVVQLVRKIQAANENALILLDEPEVSLHPSAQENMKQYLINAVVNKKLQIVIATHSPSLISGLPNSAIKLFKTDPLGKFFVQKDVSYQEAFFCIENKIESRKIVYCEDVFAKKIIEKTLKVMNMEEFVNVRFVHGGAGSIKNHHLTAFALNDELLNQVFFIFDGDQDKEYVFEEEKIPYSDETHQEEYLKECMMNAFGMVLDAFPDGSMRGRRGDQVIEDYRKYMRYYNSNVFFLPNKKIPEEIVLACNYVNREYGSILNEYEEIVASNAKTIMMKITESDHGDKKHYEETMDRLAHKWSLEESEDKNKLKEILTKIINM